MTLSFFSRIVLGGAVLAAVAGTAVASPAAMTKPEVDAAIKAYIATHGEELIASSNAAVSRAQMAKVAKMVTPQTPVSGPANAPITIVEFIDIECPYCNGVQATIREVSAKYKGKIRWVFKALPLDFHRNARPAAYAALAAQRQGKFWEYMAIIWPAQDKLGEKLYVDAAKTLKLDMKKFNADRASAAVKAQVDADLQDAGTVEARGTPFFLVNGQPVSGALPPEAFSRIIDAELAKSR